MDREINNIQVRQSESESESENARYQNHVCELSWDIKLFLMKIRLVVIN